MSFYALTLIFVMAGAAMTQYSTTLVNDRNKYTLHANICLLGADINLFGFMISAKPYIVIGSQVTIQLLPL